jgi:hypothetical protein
MKVILINALNAHSVLLLVVLHVAESSIALIFQEENAINVKKASI